MSRTIQETSRISYEEIKRERRLAESQRRVLDALSLLGRATDSEIMRALGEADPNRVRPRRFELAQAGRIRENGKRVCTVTGKLAIEWILNREPKQMELF